MINVEIPPSLRDHSNHRAEISVQATTVAAALLELKRLHPDVHRGICDETGAVRRHIHLFVNSEFVPPADPHALQSRLESGDVLMIWTAVSDG